VDPVRLTEALMQASLRLGARVDRGTTVTSLTGRNGGVEVSLSSGGVSQSARTDLAVLAAGSWSDRLAEPVSGPLPVRPVRGQQARFRPARPPRHVLRRGGYHAVPADGEVVVGATVEEVGYDLDTTDEAAGEFGRALEAMLEDGGELVEQRAGLRPKPRKGRPVIGPLPGMEQVMVATGHYKNGVLMGPLTGQVVATWMLTGAPGRDMSCFGVRR
jgi:glycine oxidase